MTRAIGRRQAGALTVMWVIRPSSVRGFILGAVLEPGGNNTHARRALAAMLARGLIKTSAPQVQGVDLTRLSYTLTNEGIEALRRYALARGAMTMEVTRG